MKFYNTKSKNKFIRSLIKKGVIISVIILSLIIIFTGKENGKIMPATSSATIETFSTAKKIILFPIHITQSAISNIIDAFSATHKNKKLEEELSQKELEIQSLKSLEFENTKLRDISGMKTKNKFEIKTAKIISDTSNNFSRSIIINLGSNDGIKRYQPAISNGALAGIISEVSPNYSRVLLIDDSSSKIPVKLEKSGIRCFLQGTNRGNPKLVLFEKETNIVKDERIVTSGFSGILPEGIFVGNIYKKNIFDEIEVKLQSPLKSIDFIEIITNFNPPKEEIKSLGETTDKEAK